METLSLSARTDLLKPSPTLSITNKANAMKAEGIDVVSFAAGEPDFNTPAPICQTAIDALNKGFTKYTPSSGTPDLKKAIVEKLQRDNGLAYTPEQIVVSCGAKHSVFNTMQVLLDPGDEVLLIAPYWMTYADQIRLAGGVPVVVRASAEAGFVPTLDQLRSAVTPRTKALILNSPSNPTGAVLPRETLKEIASLAIRHGFWIVADEIYERLVYGVEHHSIAGLGQDVYERTITINGCSKTYAMTGWRIGFAAAPAKVAKAMSNFQDQVTSNPTSFAQKGAVAAFNTPADAMEAMRAEFEARRNLILRLLAGIPDLVVPEPKGAFYVFPNFSAYLKGDTDAGLAAYLLEEARVATVPGSVFEGEGHLRLSYAASRADIEKGVERIAEALARRK
ncbi:MAG TPA: pyridoxal phosphate-dependent aminotransferase [Fimbriimonas sp.]